jgi:hypothetical protein
LQFYGVGRVAIQYLAYHLGMRDQREEHSAADDFSEQDRHDKRYQPMSQPKLPVGDQQKGFDAARDDVLEAADADKIGHYSISWKAATSALAINHAMRRSGSPRKSPKERLEPARLENMPADIDHYVAQLGGEYRGQGAKQRGCRGPGHTGGKNDCP